MAKEIFYTGLDVGSSSVRSIIARVGNEGELKVLGIGAVASNGMQKGRIENSDKVQGAIKASIDEAKRYMGKEAVSGVFAGVGGAGTSFVNVQEVISSNGNADDFSDEKLQQLIQTSHPNADKSREFLHIIPTGIQSDGLDGWKGSAGPQGGQVVAGAHLVTGDAAEFKSMTKAVQAAKVPMRRLVLQSLAAAEATLTGNERQLGTVLLDIGSGTTDMVIYQAGSPYYSAVIPVGGDQLTNDLAVALKLPWEMAEGMKVNWGCATAELAHPGEEVVVPAYQGQPRRVVERQVLVEPLQARFEEILKLALLKVRQSGLRNFPAGGLVLTGGSSELLGAKELAEETLGGPVRIAYPTGIAGLPSQLRRPMFSTTVGLLLWGIQHHGDKRLYKNSGGTLWSGLPFWSRNSASKSDRQKVAAGSSRSQR